MEILNSIAEKTSAFIKDFQPEKYKLRMRDTGSVIYVGSGVARVAGLSGVKSDELIRFAGGGSGMAFNISEDSIGVILLSEGKGIGAGQEVMKTGKVQSISVGKDMLGRVVDPLGLPLDGNGAIHYETTLPIERKAPPIINRLPVNVPLPTGIKVIDAIIPIGRGQRELILGDRQTGKSTIALDTIANQKDTGVICVYCGIGQRSTAVAKLIHELTTRGAMGHTIVMIAEGDDPPGMRYVAPYAATSVAEFFMQSGHDVLVIYDDLAKHANAYRELSLLLNRPPGREAFPGDIFYIHSKLLERATRLKEEFGGGSLTALPIVETEGENVSAYIPTNLISITDGQIYLTPKLFRKGVIPAIDVGKSVSRVGGKAQPASYNVVAGPLKLAYAQFEELEKFSKFSSRLDDETKKTLTRGYRIREILKQDRFDAMTVAEQVAVILTVTEGVFDSIPLESVKQAESDLRKLLMESAPEFVKQVESGGKFTTAEREKVLGLANDISCKYKEDINE